jgi:hypothetical protein
MALYFFYLLESNEDWIKTLLLRESTNLSVWPYFVLQMYQEGMVQNSEK